MSDYSELVERLRGVAGQTLLLSYPAQTTPDPLSNEAADAIEALEKRVAELEAALELLDYDIDKWMEINDEGVAFIRVEVDDLRQARKALGEK